MPKGMGYRTGGKHDGKGLGPYDSGSKGMVDLKAARAGNSNSPNTKETAGPGGYGSSGTKSNSTPTKG